MRRRAQLAFGCPRCGYKMDAARAIAISGDEPVETMAMEGDLSICLWCAAPLELAADEPPRWLTFDEIRALQPHHRAELTISIAAIVTRRPSRIRYAGGAP